MRKRCGVARDVLFAVGGGALYKDLEGGVSLVVLPPFPCPRSVSAKAQGQGDETYALVVDDLDNGNELSEVGPLCEDCDTADLDQSPVACRNLCVAHCAGVWSVYSRLSDLLCIPPHCCIDRTESCW